MRSEYMNKCLGIIDFDISRNLREAYQMIQNSVRAVLVVSGDLGINFMKKYYNGLDVLDNVKSIFVFSNNVQ